MKNMMKVAFGVAASFCVVNLYSTTYSNRTFLNTRPVLSNLALEYGTWNHNISKTVATDHGISLQVSGLYQKSDDRAKMGKYFGTWGKNTNTYRDFIEVYSTAYDANNDGVWSDYIVHNQGAAGGNLAGKIQFKPEQEIYGARLDFHHNLAALGNGFFVECSLPVMHIKNSVKPTAVGTLTPISITNTTAHQSTGKTLLDFFNGDVKEVTASTNFNDDFQYPLTAAKIVNSRSYTGIADLSAKLGFNFIDKETRRFGLSAIATIPTGNRVTGEYVFEPLCGNGRHWGFGAGLDGMFQLWENAATKVSFVTDVTAQYFLSEIEKRTLGIKKDDGTQIPFGHYYAAGQERLAGVFPFANVLTQELKVTPKFVAEGLFALAGAFKKLNISLGYNVFVKQRECVELAHAWENDTYAIAKNDYGSNSAFTLIGTSNADSVVQGVINSTNLDLDVATTPLQVSHKCYTTLSCATSGATPFVFGVGGSYEFGQNNAAPAAYATWLNISCAF